MIETKEGNLYDYPKYYDLVYGSDWKAEFDFLQGCFEKHAAGKVRRLFEPACGTGRLLIKLAQAGYQVAGNDLNEKMVDYCNARLERFGYRATAQVGDMADFQLSKPVDAAFNMINSFRHLSTAKQAADHLECMAEAIRPGGIYVLGLHLSPLEGDAVDEESWPARRGNLAVLSHMWTIDRNLDARKEVVGMSFDVYTPTKSFRLTDTIEFRTYRAIEMADLIETASKFRVAAIYDFAYDLSQLTEITPSTEDVVYVLKRQ